MTPNEYGNLSDLLMDAAIVGYSLAMLAFAMAMLTARVRPVEHRPVTTPVLAGTVSGPADMGASAEHGTAGADGAPGGQGSFIGWVAVLVTVAAWLAHLAQIVTRGLATDRWPWGNMYEFTSAICLAAVTAFLVLLLRLSVRYLGLYLLAVVVLGLALNATLLYKSAGPVVPALDSYWIAIHVTAAIAAIGLFTVGTVLSTLYLLAERYHKRLARGASTGSSGLIRRLPVPDVLDKLAYRMIAVAFPIWTFAVVAGAIWAEAAWGRYWGWDPKETWSFIIWTSYAAYLHARVTAGWRGRRAAIIALAAYAAILVNYFVVNIWIVGFHSYA
ncbi:MAG: c-type cytochrome biogenesis protein CcsB [Streptosporangiales bacterium]|nr:c-type cytochrome biogenesis protein CcsB [Streptosporangiales bacterium]